MRGLRLLLSFTLLGFYWLFTRVKASVNSAKIISYKVRIGPSLNKQNCELFIL